MRNFIWSFLAFFCLISVSFSQTKNIEKGSYLSTNKGQKIKLNLLEDNKYELVFYSGNYEVKGDSLLFAPNVKTESVFDLAFKNDKKAKKVKVKFSDAVYYYSFYIGTQNGSGDVQYQRLSDIREKVNPADDKLDVDFEIERADYLYLVYEEYGGNSKVSKFALPKDVSEITIKYEPEALGDLKIKGFFNQKTNELMISEQSGKDPLVFRNAKDPQPEKVSKVVSLENKTIVNFTYPGKEPLVTEDFGLASDSTAVAVESYPSTNFDFKFKIEDNLKSAIAATKSTKTKFLVVAVDNKNTSAKVDFDTFIKNQETQVSYNMYEGYNPEYDLYNFYLANADDKKWLKTNKLADTQSVIILNGNGEILATAKSNLTEKQYQLGYYDGLYKKLQAIDGLAAFSKTIKNKKATDADLIQAFNKVSVLEIPYDYNTDYAVTTDDNTAGFKFVNTTLDKKEVSQIWKKLIETHQKDTKPNMYLVETILKEIQNQGFSKQFFTEGKVLNDTDFLAIDYLIKHYDAIDAERAAFVAKEGETHVIGSLNTEIARALEQNKYVAENDIAAEKNESKTISVYKKLIAAGKGNFECYQNYFTYLADVNDKDGSNTTYLKEFSTYFNANLATDKGSVIEKLDTMFTTIDPTSDYAYNGWNAFKEYHSNLCNSAAWTVVSKPGNLSFIKSAITWSEYSLVVTKNNSYYLDTLAQLYYKDGQKQKAIETQTLAVKYLTDYVEAETAAEIRETLSKMQNGTY
ncbi:hypothetical protein ASF10_02375 [Flavobacterium sp. Leaf82]|uniref:hypothetical protein n=1 Tax=unclassified Flavobacterium TaxID=196869 RepID=UPI000700AFBF|nr:hypothetical protein [Flavobacterium sp. Leaf82]KQO34577.1 hypothetical protein ASF10_02375 [Flavobacterium sp. Leaf82]